MKPICARRAKPILTEKTIAQASRRAAFSLAAACILLTACTISPNRPVAHQDYPDASTPAGLPEFNAGILDNTLVVDGHQYDTVTPNLANAVAKWQGSRQGFIPDPRPQWKGSIAIPKATMFVYDFRGTP